MATPVGRKLTDVIKPGLRVFISAGASGIGRAIADMLILHGAKVHICDVSQDFLNDFKQQHPQHGATLADVSKEADVARLFEDIAASLGGLDALINNAGIAGPTGGVDEITPADWRRCIDICLTGQFLCARHAVPMLKAAGGGVDRQHVVGGRPARLRVPHALFRRQVRRHRLHPEPRQGARAAQHPGQCHPARHRRGSAHRRRDPRPRRAARRLLRGDGEGTICRRSRCAAWSARTTSPRWCVPAVADAATISPASRSASTAMSRRFEEQMTMASRDRRQRA